MAILYIDVDDTSVDLLSEWLRLYNNDYEDSITPANILSWDVHTYVRPECGIKIYKYLKNIHLYDNILPIKNSIECINQLREDGHRIIFATASHRSRAMSYRKFDRMEELGFRPEFKSYIELQDKSLLCGDVLLDDGIHNLENFEGHKFLFHQAHNKDCQLYHRIFDWNEFVAEIRRICS